MGDTAEIHQLTVKNTGATPKSLKLFSFIEWCLWNAYDDMTNYQRNFSTGEVEVEGGGSTIYHKTEYRERRDHFAFYDVNAPVAGFDTDRETFFGLYNDFERAAGRRQGRVVELGRQRLGARSRRTASTSTSRPARRRRSSSRSATSRTRATRSGRSRASSTRRAPRR